jgi:two-component system CheB/CheR fusion protein
MPVVQVQNDTALEPKHVYVIPPNTLMRVRNRALTLEARPDTPEKFRPIDVFFSSLADEFSSNAVGIVLSGTASDGTLGLKAIKAEGGITLAQNQTAKFDGMPRSAIAAGVVDLVLPPRRIAEELAAIAHRGLHLVLAEREMGAGDGTTLHRLLLLLRKCASRASTKTADHYIISPNCIYKGGPNVSSRAEFHLPFGRNFNSRLQPDSNRLDLGQRP